MRWFCPLVKKLAFYHWFGRRAKCTQVLVGPDGERTPARRSLIKNVEIRSKSLGSWGRRGAKGGLRTTPPQTGLMAGFPSPSVQIKIPCDDCHSICLLDDSRTGNLSQFELQRLEASENTGHYGPPLSLSKTVARSSLPPEPNRAFPGPCPSRSRKTLAAKRSPRGFAHVFDPLVHFGETHRAL
jgi:hypothetical protein